MTRELLARLRAQSPSIHVRWEALLRIEPVSSPLANPNALATLIPETLAQILTSIAELPAGPRTLKAAKAEFPLPCNCGNNPYLAYFVAAEQALVETVILLQSELPARHRTEGDVAVVVCATRRLAREEIDTFCSICTHRGSAPTCRHVVTA